MTNWLPHVTIQEARDLAYAMVSIKMHLTKKKTAELHNGTLQVHEDKLRIRGVHNWTRNIDITGDIQFQIQLKKETQEIHAPNLQGVLFV